ncbi:MAG: helix-turn-helix transcriptional regulator [Thermoanaerobacter sp.]|nr:helix-turn-helix transcriptional regulator [Thermoanaerobacter sp.]
MIIGKRIKELREQLGLTQEELAEKVGISRSALANYESGLREPKGDILVRFANALNTTTDYLLGKTSRTDKPDPERKNTIEEEFPEISRVLRRAGRKLTPADKRRIARIIQAAIEDTDDEA